jgi:hypothetical protein
VIADRALDKEYEALEVEVLTTGGTINWKGLDEEDPFMLLSVRIESLFLVRKS